MVTKSEIRQRALRARRSVEYDELAELSRRVALKLFSLPEFRKARTMASYVAKTDEVQTVPIILRALSEGKRVIVPRTESSPKRLRFFELRAFDELEAGNFGVLEPTTRKGRVTIPVSIGESDAILVPLVAWDELGNRIGYGKGYFDAELRSRRSAPAIGLGLESQRVDRVPATDRDVPLDIMVTERRVLRFSNRAGQSRHR